MKDKEQQNNIALIADGHFRAKEVTVDPKTFGIEFLDCMVENVSRNNVVLAPDSQIKQQPQEKLYK